GWTPRLNYRNSKGPSGSLQLLLQSLNITDTDHTGRGTPCCQDTLGSGVCKSMSRRSPDRFLHQCRTNADFSFIQCCASCHFVPDVQLRGIDGRVFSSPTSLYDYDVDRMLQSKNAHCIDRRTARFCENLVTQKIHDKSTSRVLDIYKGMPSGYKDLKSLIGGIDLLRDAPCESSALAFRVCRKTCGYCSREFDFFTQLYYCIPFHYESISGETAASLIGRTPCCADSLTALTCQRLAINHPASFAHKCMHNADFAFVQCCSSCFDRRFSNSSGLYGEAVARLINRPQHGDCRDARGVEWCTKFAKRELDMRAHKQSRSGMWEPWFRQGCDAFPFAFRVCRSSCGFCTTGLKRTSINYNYVIATDRIRCPLTKAFSDKAVATPDFNPLAHLNLSAWKEMTGDYFVVIDHNYNEDLKDDREFEDFDHS
ncbi:hypothetical protein PFISCL1PPCAC_23923, partial [Pristionchus fissidentatus]